MRAYSLSSKTVYGALASEASASSGNFTLTRSSAANETLDGSTATDTITTGTGTGEIVNTNGTNDTVMSDGGMDTWVNANGAGDTVTANSASIVWMGEQPNMQSGAGAQDAPPSSGVPPKADR
jgi:hypothetical protein